MKSWATLDGVFLAANQSITWSFVAGTAPYQTQMQMHRSRWEEWRRRGKLGKPVELKIADERGTVTTIKDVFVLHEVPSDSPNRASFVVSDRRWKWPYTLVSRDYNLPRKTGDRDAFGNKPIEKKVVVDKYDYLPHSLNNGTKKWTPLEALQDALYLVEGDETTMIESFPIKGGSEVGQFSMQGVTLRDSGDAAIARLLSFIPGAGVYVDAEGQVVVYDAANYGEAVDKFVKGLPGAVWGGQVLTDIDRSQMRPRSLNIHYEREIEVLTYFEDDYGNESVVPPDRNTPYLENVVQTVDQNTTITYHDPEEAKSFTVSVPAGTWVPMREWLVAMDLDRPTGSWPWTFETIRRHWVEGDLDGVLGGGGEMIDDLSTSNVSLRIQALKQHFRQTFRINRRYMLRIRELKAVRAFLLDPITGARAPADVWSQACIIPSKKGARMIKSRKETEPAIYRNIDYLAPERDGLNIINTAPGPTDVQILDRDLGIFHLSWINDVVGNVQSYIPCLLENPGASNAKQVPVKNMALQDKPNFALGGGFRIETGAGGIALARKMEMKCMLTMVPAAPNNLNRYHTENVKAEDITKFYVNKLPVEGGQGPVMDVFINPAEETMRFSYIGGKKVAGMDLTHYTLRALLGLDMDDPTTSGIPGNVLRGYVQVNEQRDVRPHAEAVAAEIYSMFVDSKVGSMATVPIRQVKGQTKSPNRLIANLSGITISLAAATSGKVSAGFDFSAQQRMISRFALLPEATRRLVLGIVKFEGER